MQDGVSRRFGASHFSDSGVAHIPGLFDIRNRVQVNRFGLFLRWRLSSPCSGASGRHRVAFRPSLSDTSLWSWLSGQRTGNKGNTERVSTGPSQDPYSAQVKKNLPSQLSSAQSPLLLNIDDIPATMKWSILTSVLIATGALARPSRLEAPHRETLEEAGGSRYKHLYRSIKTLTPLPPAVNVKKLVHNVVTGTMASVFPKDSPDAGTSRLFAVEIV